jgi:hypothetical protein
VVNELANNNYLAMEKPNPAHPIPQNRQIPQKADLSSQNVEK